MLRRAFLVLAVLAVVSCDGSRDKLLADLQSPRPEERALAVRKLAQQGHPDDLVLFTRAAKDPSAIVRGEAAGALAKSQDPRVVDLLGDLLEDADEDVQSKAAMALAEIKTDKSKGYLTVQYARRSRRTRLAIVQALKASNVPGAMAGVVAAEAQSIWDRNLHALQEGMLPERVAAAEELGRSGRVEAVSRLTALTRDSQVILAAAAVRGLGFAGDTRVVDPVASLLNENFPELREAACDALGELQDRKPLPALEAVALEKSATSPVATRAIATLPRGEDTDKALCEIVLDGAPGDAMTAGREMRKRKGCPVGPIQDRLAKARDAASLVQVLQAVTALGPSMQELAPKIVPALSHSDAVVRQTALEAVSAIGDPSAGPAVQKVYDGELKNVQALRAKWVSFGDDRRGAVVSANATVGAGQEQVIGEGKFKEMLAKSDALTAERLRAQGKVPSTTRVPIELADDASEDQLRPFARTLRALGAVKAPGAQETLARWLNDPSAVIRSGAAVGLARLGKDGVALASQALYEADRDVQGEVAQALAEDSDEGRQAVAEALGKVPGDRVRLLQALQRGGVPASAGPELVKILKDNGAEAALAVSLLGELKDKSAVEPLLKLLDDPTTGARREALLALGQIGDGKAAETIAKDLASDNPDVREAAAQALASVGTVAQFESLDALKGDYYRRVREAAAAALTKVGGPTAETRK